jgi:microcompartment protein CcmL/EutN
MERDSLGLIETSGLVAAIEAADAGSKAANVTFRGYERARAGLITVVFLGDVAAVHAAVTAGSAAARRVGTVISVHVIARPDRQLHVRANGAKPLEALVSGSRVEPTVPEPSKTKTAESDPVIAEAPDTVATSPSCEIPGILQTGSEPAEQVTESLEEPGVEGQPGEPTAEVERAADYLVASDHLAVEDEAEVAVVAAGHASTPHKKEKVRKPKSKRRV